MPSLVAEVGKVELFIHDSLNTCKNTLSEMEQAASVMSPGGVIPPAAASVATPRRHADTIRDSQ